MKKVAEISGTRRPISQHLGKGSQKGAVHHGPKKGKEGRGKVLSQKREENRGWRGD